VTSLASSPCWLAGDHEEEGPLDNERERAMLVARARLMTDCKDIAEAIRKWLEGKQTIAAVEFDD
jgi:hypothetical protein